MTENVPGSPAQVSLVEQKVDPYNPIFEKFVDNGDEELLGIVAYGIYKKAKREWASEIYKNRGTRPTNEELRAYTTTWTASQFDNARNSAAQVLSAYADAVIQAEEPKILKRALQGNFRASVLSSIVASFVYTLILIGIALVLALAGVDLVGIFNKVLG